MWNKFKAALLPDIKEPSKLPTKAKVLPKFLGKAKGATIPNNATNTTSLDRANFARSAADINGVIANLVRTSPDLSQAVATKISSGISRTYKVIAYDETGRVDEKGTELAQAFCFRLDNSSYDYTRFTRSTDLRSMSSSLLLDLLRYGGMCGELVLGQGRLPAYIRPFSTNLIKWGDGGDISYPIYKSADGDVPLNFSTIFYSSTAQDLESAYAESPLQTAIQPALWDTEFQDHLRRAAHKNLMQRLRITIDSEKWKATLPFEVQSDTEKLKEYTEATIDSLETQLAGLSPEDALVIFDNLTAETMQDSNRSEDRSIDILENLINGQLASGAKILPSIIGRGQSSSAASTEAMLFVKAVSAIQNELNIFYSRVLTLAVRLLGAEVTVKFTYGDVNLRPEIELESFKAVRQARILEQLSLGLISDSEASIELTGTLPPDGYTELAGTMFKNEVPDTSENDYSNTSATAEGKTDSTQSTKDSNPDTPTGVPGKNSS